jgi:hypothetical protein
LTVAEDDHGERERRRRIEEDASSASTASPAIKNRAALDQTLVPRWRVCTPL